MRNVIFDNDRIVSSFDNDLVVHKVPDKEHSKEYARREAAKADRHNKRIY